MLLAVGKDSARLLLVGDPCQAIFSGKDFKFSWWKELVYKATGTTIPDPIQLRTNFRTTGAIVRLGAFVLRLHEHLFGEDDVVGRGVDGQVEGSQPGYFCRPTLPQLVHVAVQDLSVVVLVRDELVGWLIEKMNECRVQRNEVGKGIPTVLGIRASKGLEFDKVLIFGWFSSAPSHLVDHYRTMFSDINDDGILRGDDRQQASGERRELHNRAVESLRECRIGNANFRNRSAKNFK